MAGGSQPVAPLAAVIGARDLGEALGTEVEHLPVEMRQLVQERAALATRPRLEVSLLTVRDKVDNRRGHRRSPSSSSAAW